MLQFPIIERQLSLIVAEQVALFGQGPHLILDLFYFVHTSEFEVLAKLREIFNSLLIILPLSCQFDLVLLDPIFQDLYPGVLFLILELPKVFSLHQQIF